MNLFAFYSGILRFQPLRKKSILIFLLIALALIVLCLQFISRSENELKKSEEQMFEDRKYNNLIKISDILKKERGKSVQFLKERAVTSSETGFAQVQVGSTRTVNKEFRVNNNQKFPDQPTRDEISRRRNSFELFTAYPMRTSDFALKSGIKTKEEIKNEMYDSVSYSMGIPEVTLESYVPKQRLVHFDLKGAPPKINYLKKVITLSKQLGATGLLLEYEDMFPFHGTLSEITANNAYSENDIAEILSFAKAHGLDVIPLVQTFGHVEFALKLQKFAHLREVPESPQALCPSNNSSLNFVENLIDQVMKFHSSTKYIHIGCDEVFQMGECPKCRLQPRHNLFLSHVARVADYIKKNYPNVTPIIWDDMLRHLSTQSLEEFNLGKLVEPMVWVYAEDIYRFVPTLVWDKYAEIFPRIWAASAFKGAFGETLYIPNAKRHLENNLRWLEVMTSESQKFKNGFSGIAITGWQRYDHFAVLCELLPAAIPSLAINLLATTHGYFNQSLRNKLYNVLNCQSDSKLNFGIVNFNNDPFMWNKLSRCFFPGSAFFKLLYRFHSTEKEIKEFLDVTTKSKGWMTDYNIRHNFSSPLRVDELMTDFSRTFNTLISLIRQTKETLQEVFDQYTINEWIEQNLYPYLRKLENLEMSANILKAVKYWPRRPLKTLNAYSSQTPLSFPPNS